MTVVRRDFRSGTLYLGDVLEVLRLAEGMRVDLVLTYPFGSRPQSGPASSLRRPFS